jgi:hypothetical protein
MLYKVAVHSPYIVKQENAIATGLNNHGYNAHQP